MLSNASFIQLYCRIAQSPLGVLVPFTINNGVKFEVVKTRLMDCNVLAVICKSNNGIKLIEFNGTWQQDLGSFLQSLGAVSVHLI